MQLFENVQIPISSEEKSILLARLLNLGDGFRTHEAEYDEAAYLAYYGQQRRAAEHDENHILISNPDEICELAKQILQGSPREDIIHQLSLKHPDVGGDMGHDRTLQLSNR